MFYLSEPTELGNLKEAGRLYPTFKIQRYISTTVVAVFPTVMDIPGRCRTMCAMALSSHQPRGDTQAERFRLHSHPHNIVPHSSAFPEYKCHALTAGSANGFPSCFERHHKTIPFSCISRKFDGPYLREKPQLGGGDAGARRRRVQEACQIPAAPLPVYWMFGQQGAR